MWRINQEINKTNSCISACIAYRSSRWRFGGVYTGNFKQSSHRID